MKKTATNSNQIKTVFSQYWKSYLFLIPFLAAITANAQWVQKGIGINGANQYDKLGVAVSLSADGNTMAIGTEENSDGGNLAGQVQVYSWNGGAWVLKGMKINGESAINYFGTSVSLSADGNTLIAGGRINTNAGGTQAGHSRIYNWNGTAWIQKGMDIDGAANYDGSGTSVDISSDGDVVIIGASGDSFLGTGNCKAYSWSGSAWIQRGSTILGDAVGDIAGGTVSISSDGNIIAIGAKKNDQGGGNSGQVKIFEWNSIAWIQKGNSILGDSINDQFGTSISLSDDGNTITASAIYNDVAGNNSGHVKILDWNGAAWVQRGASILGASAGDGFGSFVDINSDGNSVAVGARYADPLASQDGTTRIFDWNGAAWVQNGSDIDGGNAGDQSGTSGAISANGKVVAIGAPYYDYQNTNIGQVNVFFSDTCVSVISDLIAADEIICAGGSTTISFTGTLNPNATQWALYKDSCTGAKLDSSISTTSFTVSPTTTTTYFINGKSSCSSMNFCAPITILVNTVENFPISGDTSLCAPTSGVSIGLDTTETGVVYYLRNDLNDTLVDGPFTGTGNSISFATGAINTTTTYNILADKNFLGNALDFDGADDRIVVPNSASVNFINAMTIEAWIYPTAYPVTYPTVVSKYGWEFDIKSDNTLEWEVRLSSGFKYINGGTITLNQWQHVVGVYDGAYLFIYINGVKIDSTAATGTIITDANDLEIASRGGGGNYFEGKMDGVRLWNVARTESEIFNNMEACLNGSEAGLAAYYSFDDGKGSAVVTDFTVNNNNGTLTDMDVNSDWIDGILSCQACSIEMASLVTVNIGTPTVGTITDIQTACDSYLWIDGTTYTSSNTTATFTLMNATGCDSVITLNLTINTVDATVTPNDPSITANATAATYQWLDCGNSNAVITGETSQTFNASTNGDYAVMVSENGCTDTSTCTTISTLGVANELFNNVSIYPNPNKGMINIDLGLPAGQAGVLKDVTVKIMNVNGQIVYSSENINTPTFQFELNGAFGIYFMEINTQGESQHYKLIKK